MAARMVIAALFKNMIVIRYCGANETADYCCIFGHFDLLYYGKLDSLCDTCITIKLDVFVALQAFDLKDFLEVSMIKWKVNNHLGINLKITHNFNLFWCSLAVIKLIYRFKISQFLISPAYNSNLNYVDIFGKFSL